LIPSQQRSSAAGLRGEELDGGVAKEGEHALKGAAGMEAVTELITALPPALT
jgi:hypothetical protein